MSPTDPHTILPSHIAAAKQIIVTAGLVGDRDDFETWMWRCKEWTAGLAAALKYLYGDEATRTFQMALNAPERHTPWQASLRAELDRLTDTIQMLIDLLQAPPPPTSPRTTSSSPASPERTPTTHAARSVPADPGTSLLTR
jgi:hypothetical protein